MLRSRFQSLPRAFNAKLIPVEKSSGGKSRWIRDLTGKNDNVSSFFLLCHLVEFIASTQQDVIINVSW
jgi:hypothetical protein